MSKTAPQTPSAKPKEQFIVLDGSGHRTFLDEDGSCENHAVFYDAEGAVEWAKGIAEVAPGEEISVYKLVRTVRAPVGEVEVVDVTKA